MVYKHHDDRNCACSKCTKNRHMIRNKDREQENDWERNRATIDRQNSVEDLDKFIEVLDLEILQILAIKELCETRATILKGGAT